jgi:hypothetical protein
MMQVPGFDTNGTEENIIPRKAILERTLPWEGYHKAAIISERELEYIRRYDKKPEDIKKQLIEKVCSLNANVIEKMVFLFVLVGVVPNAMCLVTCHTRLLIYSL